MKNSPGKILKNAWLLAWYNKYLWWFGFFLSLGGGLNFFPRVTNFSKTSDASDFNTHSFREIMQYSRLYLDTHVSVIVYFLLFILLLLLALWILRVIAKGALIASFYKISSGEKMSFQKSWSEGLLYWTRLFKVELLVSGIGIILLIILFLPVFWLFWVKKIITAVLLLITAFIIFVFLSIIFHFLMLLASFYIVIGKVSVQESLNLAYLLLRRKWKDILIIALTLLGINYLVFILLILVVSLLAILAVMIGALGLAISKAVLTGVIVISLLALVLLILFLGSCLNVFRLASWYYLFIEIAGNQTGIKKESLEVSEREKALLTDAGEVPLNSK